MGYLTLQGEKRAAAGRHICGVGQLTFGTLKFVAPCISDAIEATSTQYLG